MRIRELAFVLALSFAVFGAPVLAAEPPAQTPRPATRIATANPYVIYRQIKETQDFKDKDQAELKQFQAEAAQRQNGINEQKSKIAQFAPDNPMYADLARKIDQMTADAKAWQEVTERQQNRVANQRFLNTYKKIEAAVALIAQRDNFDIVLSTGLRELPANVEGVPFADLDKLIAARHLMYVKDSVDISQQVVTLLDADYAKAGKKP